MRTPSPGTGGQTDFGFTSVPLERKQALVDDVFAKVASRYDLMNDLMSMGLHREWKNILVAMVHPAAHRPYAHLDVAGGTGDVAFRIIQAGGPRTRTTVLDINGPMLGVCRDRADALGLAAQIDVVQASAEDLPFPDAHFDSYTVAFGIRNVPRIEVALAEAYRVLKRGGRFLCLEFTSVDLPGLAQIYDAYSFNVVPELGRQITGDAQPYRYLVESIRKFPQVDVFEAMIAAAGFRRTSATRLSGGIVAIHSGWKL